MKNQRALTRQCASVRILEVHAIVRLHETRTNVDAIGRESERPEGIVTQPRRLAETGRSLERADDDQRWGKRRILVDPWRNDARDTEQSCSAKPPRQPLPNCAMPRGATSLRHPGPYAACIVACTASASSTPPLNTMRPPSSTSARLQTCRRR